MYLLFFCASREKQLLIIAEFIRNATHNTAKVSLKISWIFKTISVFYGTVVKKKAKDLVMSLWATRHCVASTKWAANDGLGRHGVDSSWLNVRAAMAEWSWQGKCKALGEELSQCQFIHNRRTMGSLAGLCEDNSATNRLNYGKAT